MTQSEFNAMLQVAIAEGLPGGSFTMKYSWEEIEAIMDRALPGGAIDSVLSSKPNPNLLDNWYFGNPVDQRGGRVVVPNTTYYSDNTLATAAGTTSAYVTAYRYATGTASGVSYASFKLTDSDTAPTYYAAPENVVRGYTGAGHTIDRYSNTNASNVLLIEDDGIRFIGTGDGGFHIKIEPHMIEIGRTYTLSVLVDEIVGTGYIAQWATPTPVIKVGMNTLTFVAHENTWQGTSVVHLLNGEVKVRAAKLELGTTQTLAHQDENGNLVLNEIPDYGEQLRRCMRYFQVVTNGTLVGSLYTSQAGRVYYKFPVTMRDNPGIINNPKGLTLWGHSPGNGYHTVNLYTNPNATVDGFDIDFSVNDAGTFGTSGWGVVINTIDVNTKNNEPICWANAEL